MEIPKHVNWPGWEAVRKLGSGSFDPYTADRPTVF